MIMALVSDEFKLIAASFCLNEEEIKKAAMELDTLIAGEKNFVEDVFSKKKNRRPYVARLLRPIFIRICMARPILYEKDITADAIESAVMDA